jgi:hypothetical protein
MPHCDRRYSFAWQRKCCKMAVMKTPMSFVVVTLLAFCLAACDDKPATPAPTPAADQKPKTDPPQKPPYKPEYAIAIEESKPDPKQYTVTWKAKVNSEGWTMKTDSVLVEEHNGAMACRIWVTLEEPNPSETVKETMTEVTGKHDAGTTKIERVEFSVRQNIRGVKYLSPNMYSVVKSIKYPY